MPDPTLFGDTVDNRGLFSDHYLTSRFPARDDVQALADEADAAFEQVQDRMAQVAPEVDQWNEAETEDEFVQPVLRDVLGWARKVQKHVQRQGRTGRPDYALFTSPERKATAVQRAREENGTVYTYADAVADAKYWGRPLDGPAPNPTRETTAEMRRNNPSFQIIDYVTLTGVEWGLLTNGSHWRLYYEKAPSRLETYLEVDLERVCHLAHSDDAEERAEAHRAFRLFYGLFRADAHRERAGSTFVETCLLRLIPTPKTWKTG